jgi:hypothetical protein
VPFKSAETCAMNGWTNSGLVVRKGQRLRITSSGRVSLGGGRFERPQASQRLLTMRSFYAPRQQED